MLAVFPELCLSGYANDDLFFQDALLDQVEQETATILAGTRDLGIALIIGAPLRLEGKLLNCALILCRGEIAGAVPKNYLPNYREFYEKRQFTAGSKFLSQTTQILGRDAPIGAGLLFDVPAIPNLTFHVEVCEDVWVPLPPSTFGALAGATVLANLSASNVTVGKADYRRLLCSSQSAKCIAAYLYSGAGVGESTTDLAWDGHGLIYENGDLLAETKRYLRQPGLILADVDLDRLVQDRARTTSFNDCASDWRTDLSTFRRVRLDIAAPAGEIGLIRTIPRFPYVPADATLHDERCAEVYAIQVHGLATRLEASGISKAVVGVSGGLDSAQALIVVAKCFDILGWPRQDILACSLPGFGTSAQSKQRAHDLMNALGVSIIEIDIKPSAQQMLRDIGHPYAAGRPVFDITFENVQAGERASHLFRLANLHNALVVGTSDLSELALGYTTYGVGDHMAHYHVNASVPKTLIQSLLRWAARQFDDATCAALESIAGAVISAELVPDSSDSPHSAQETVGPYQLQDFNLYYLSRFGYRPSKIAYLAHEAWGAGSLGPWPAWVPSEQRVSYDLRTIASWLEVFIKRFFRNQFKRSAIPNSPKVGSGGSLSPRSDWRAPSDASAEAWLEELRENLPSDRDG